jgi:hypothetical protein
MVNCLLFESESVNERKAMDQVIAGLARVELHPLPDSSGDNP